MEDKIFFRKAESLLIGFASPVFLTALMACPFKETAPAFIKSGLFDESWCKQPFEPKPDCTDAVLSIYFLFLSFKNGRRESGAARRHRELDFSLPKKNE